MSFSSSSSTSSRTSILTSGTGYSVVFSFFMLTPESSIAYSTMSNIGPTGSAPLRMLSVFQRLSTSAVMLLLLMMESKASMKFGFQMELRSWIKDYPSLSLAPISRSMSSELSGSGKMVARVTGSSLTSGRLLLVVVIVFSATSGGGQWRSVMEEMEALPSTSVGD